jgi:diguanylate cyclase (GGDEF)-like protein/hemerythrin-like metal-binding protein
MAAFLMAQLDYVYFVYGLALVLLGAVSLSLKTQGPLSAPWGLLAAFAFTRGIVEWLALVGLQAGDPPALRLAGTVLHAAACFLLLEFARRTLKAMRGKSPGPWIHGVLAAAVASLVGLGGTGSLGTAVQLAVGVPATLWTAFLLASASTAANQSPASARALAWGAASLGAFGLAACVVGQGAPFLPAAWPTAASFLGGAGVPIDLVRAAFVGVAALSIWGYAVSVDERARLRRKRSRSFQFMALAILAVLALGWVFTERLGRLHEEQLIADTESVSAQIQDHLLMEMEIADDAVRVLAGIASRFPPSLAAAGTLQAERDEAVDVVAGGRPDRIAFLLDTAGITVAASNRSDPDSFVGKDYSMRSYHQDAAAGFPGRFVGIGLSTRVPGFYASQPIRGADGKVTGVAVVKKNLDAESFGPKGTDLSFIAASDGRVLLAGSLRFEGRPLWKVQAAGSASDVAPGPAPVLDHAVAGTDWVTLEGARHAAVRRSIPGSEWHVVTLKRQSEQAVNRLLGIVITFLLSVVIVFFFVVLERQYGAESRLVDKHREAEGRAREMARRADTDALTGVLNRLGFNEAFSREFSRARRYRQPLSIVLVDLDRFKQVNDQHGHPAGDRVLAGAARLLEANIRDSDSAARWGGEEFAILAPMTDAAGAAQLAEKIRGLLEVTHLGPTGAVTASFGVTEMRPDDTVEAMVDRADLALYRAKESGRNRVLCAEAWVDLAQATASVARSSARGIPSVGGKELSSDTGFAPMDAEHRALAEELVDLVARVEAGNVAEIRPALSSLVAEVADHFAREDRLMALHDYPLRTRHEEAHALFLEDARRFQGELEKAGADPTFRRWATGRLPEWFRYHILAHDMGLGQFLGKVGASGSEWTSRREGVRP